MASCPEAMVGGRRRCNWGASEPDEHGKRRILHKTVALGKCSRQGGPREARRTSGGDAEGRTGPADEVDVGRVVGDVVGGNRATGAADEYD